jgi:hypothetical protein
MTSTSTHTGRAAGETVSAGARSAGSQALSAASRQLLATAGNQVLKAAVDRAVGKVDHVAVRLDAVASGDRRKPSANRKPRPRPAEQREHRSVDLVKVRVGAAFNLVMQQALRLLQLIQRLAQQLLAALSRLVRRSDEGASTPELTETQTDSQVLDRVAPRKQVDKTERADGRPSAERPRPAGGQPARSPSPQAARREGRRPAAREAAGAPRRVAGERPVRTAQND